MTTFRRNNLRHLATSQGLPVQEHSDHCIIDGCIVIPSNSRVPISATSAPYQPLSANQAAAILGLNKRPVGRPTAAPTTPVYVGMPPFWHDLALSVRRSAVKTVVHWLKTDSAPSFVKHHVPAPKQSKIAFPSETLPTLDAFCATMGQSRSFGLRCLLILAIDQKS